jgi:tripartite-type tricarboxylate transporter receptor subunit TctC
VPTFAEQCYPTVNFHLEMLLLAPAGLAPEVAQRLSAAAAAAMRSSEMRAQLHAIGIEASSSGPAEAAALIAHDTAIYGELITKLGLKPE